MLTLTGTVAANAAWVGQSAQRTEHINSTDRFIRVAGERHANAVKDKFWPINDIPLMHAIGLRSSQYCDVDSAMNLQLHVNDSFRHRPTVYSSGQSCKSLQFRHEFYPSLFLGVFLE